MTSSTTGGLSWLVDLSLLPRVGERLILWLRVIKILS